jgi:triosephosphate isomerase (TIM)
MLQPLIIANWKMHKTHLEAHAWMKDFSACFKPLQALVVLAPPFTALERVSECLKASPALVPFVHLGAQTMSAQAEGAFTGEISPLMLKALDVKYVMLGHSERREGCHETNAILNLKVQAALKHGLRPILCIGENAQTQAEGQTLEFLKQQINESLSGLDALAEDRLCELSIAYEPIWAIGTGRAASPESIQSIHSHLREHLITRFGPAANKIPLLYGGSIKASNAASILGQEAVDGALVGGASLDPAEFFNIVQAAVTAK